MEKQGEINQVSIKVTGEDSKGSSQISNQNQKIGGRVVEENKQANKIKEENR